MNSRSLAAIAFYVFMNGWDGREKVVPTLLYMGARTVVALTSGLIFKLFTVNVWDEENINEGEDEEEALRRMVELVEEGLGE